MANSYPWHPATSLNRPCNSWRHLPAVEYSPGTIPIQVTRFRPFRNALALPTAAIKTVLPNQYRPPVVSWGASFLAVYSYNVLRRTIPLGGSQFPISFPKLSKFGSRFLLLLAVHRERVTPAIGFPPTCELFLSSLLHELQQQPEHRREDH